jgi:hypothetical protein
MSCKADGKRAPCHTHVPRGLRDELRNVSRIPRTIIAPMTIPAVRLINGHPDDENAEASALSVLDGNKQYGAEWPRETAVRYLHAVTSGDSEKAKVTAPPSEHDLSQLLRGAVPNASAIALFEAFLGTERVTAELASFLERGGNDDGVIELLGVMRERLPVSDRSRLDARLRILTRTSVVPAIESMLKPKAVSRRPPPPKSEPPAPKADKKPAAKKKAKKPRA